MTLIGIGGLLLIIWVARESYTSLPARLPEMLPITRSSIWGGILMGSFIAFYAFLGFEDIVNIAEETRNPSRNLPLAIISALIIITLLYLAIALLAILTVPPAQLAQTDAPLAMIYSHITGQPPVIITIISLISVINGALVQIIKASRILYGMSRLNWLPTWLGRVNARTRTPLPATFVVVGIVLIFALTLPLLSLAKLTSFITLIVFALVNFSLLRIKRQTPKHKGTFTVPQWVPLTGFISSSCFVLYQIYYLIR
jgi:amino acid transporter